MTSSQSPRSSTIACTASAASRFNVQLGATTAMRIANPYVLESVTSAIGEKLSGSGVALVVTPVVVSAGAMAIKAPAVPVAASWIELTDNIDLLASIGPAMPIRAAVESTATAVAGLSR